MTLVISLISNDVLWILADRRLSWRNPFKTRDNAVKIVEIETRDGIGLLSYAGLGLTSNGSQLSDWMSAALRGRPDMTFEQLITILADVARNQLPEHLAELSRKYHLILASAFIRQTGARIYTIENDLEAHRDREAHAPSFGTRLEPNGPKEETLRVTACGNGKIYFKKGMPWERELRGLARAHDNGRISPPAIADRLAQINGEVHKNVREVGPDCIVVWRRNPDSRPGPAGGQQFYTGSERDGDSPCIPMISNGLDTRAIVNLISAVTRPTFGPDGSLVDSIFDEDEMIQRLREIPHEPDEHLH